MAYLKDCQADIDAGKTAKHLRWRSMLNYLIYREGEYYARHAEGYTNPDGLVIVKPQTIHYRTWDDVLDAFNGYYNDNGWILVGE